MWKMGVSIELHACGAAYIGTEITPNIKNDNSY